MIEKKSSLNKVEIRWYVPNDYDAVKSLIQGLAKLYNDDFNEYFFKKHMDIRMLEPSVVTFVAVFNNEVCGCAYADSERDPRGVLHGRISNVNVKTEFQGKRIGAALVDESITFLSALHVPNIWANVNPNNEAMIKLFEIRKFRKMLNVMEKRIAISPCMKTDVNIKDITIRSMLERDLPDVKILILKLAAVFNETFEPYWFDLTVQKYFQDPASRIFIAEKNGMLVGITFAEIRRDPMGNSYGYISNIMVHELVRGQGIGSLLLQQASIFLSNLNVATIWANVNHNNDAMKKIFEGQGYTEKFIVMVKFENSNYDK